jgi:cell division protein FtsQ
MAYMKLEGARRVSQSLNETLGSPRKVGLMLASAVLMTGLAVAGALWIGGSLVDAREAFADIADHEAAQLGFGAASVTITGVSGARADEVRAAILPPGKESLFSAKPAEVRARIEALNWVEKASVRRLWPSSVRINVTRRQAYALWKQGKSTAVVDAAGKQLANVRWNDFTGLPIVIGYGAGPAAQPLLGAVENSPALRGRVVSATRVSDRRWDLTLKSGTVLALPTENTDTAIKLVARLQSNYQLLDRPLGRIDLRQPGRVLVAPRPELAGGPGLVGA